jgi:hypothetical protein
MLYVWEARRSNCPGAGAASTSNNKRAS